MSDQDFEKLLGGFAADTLTPEERRQLFSAALQDQQLFNALADEQALKELLTDPAVRRRVLHALNKTTPAPAVGGPVSWLDWLRRPANLALAGGLATAIVAVVLGTRIYQDSLRHTAPSVATEATRPATPPTAIPPAAQPAPSQPAELQSKASENGARSAARAKTDALTDKPVTGEQTAQSPLQEYPAADTARELAPNRSGYEEDRIQTDAPMGGPSQASKEIVAPADQRAVARSALKALPRESKKMQAPAAVALPETGSSTVSARALFYGESIPPETDRLTKDNEPEMKSPGETEAESGPFKRKLEGLSQRSKAAAPAMPPKPLGLRYSFAGRTPDGQQQEIDSLTALATPTPVQLTIETNQDGYIQIWKNVGSAQPQLLLPQKESGHISLKIQAGRRQDIQLPPASGMVTIRLSRVPFGPITRQEAALLDRLPPDQLQETVTAGEATGSEELATYIVSRDATIAQLSVSFPAGRPR